MLATVCWCAVHSPVCRRFDRNVQVPNPDVGGRRQILEMYLEKIPKADDVQVRMLALNCVIGVAASSVVCRPLLGGLVAVVLLAALATSRADHIAGV